MTTQIHKTALVSESARIGEGVSIGPYAVIEGDVEIKDGCTIHAHAVITGRTELGRKCTVFPHAVIGGAPQVIGFQDEGNSRLIIGDNCVFREHTTAHTGMPKFGGETRIGDNCYFMIGSHIAHDNTLGDNVVMANNVCLAGHVEIGDNVWLGGLAAVHQFTRIGRQAFIGGGAILVDDVIPFGSVVGNHARLAGLNVVGLKRRGFTKQDILSIRRGYRMIFQGEGTFSDRVDRAADQYADEAHVMEMIDFIRTAKHRPICQPARVN